MAAVWTNLTSHTGGASPPGREQAAFAYDVADSEWVLFGGCGVICPSNDTWAFSHGGWTNLTGNGPAPEARRSASMTYDANAGGLLLFGGARAGNADLNSTWLFRGGTWTNVSYLGGGPLPRRDSVLVFDPSPGVNGSLLFGGCYAVFISVVCLNDTWVWHLGSGWIPSSTGTAPASRGDGAAVYDPAARAVVLFGGFAVCGSTYCTPHDTWEFYGGQWWPLAVTGQVPSGRLAPEFAFDAGSSGDVLFGGLNLTNSSDTGDTWLFANGGWSELGPSLAPSNRSGGVMTSDDLGDAPVLFGGIDDATGGVLSDTWVFGQAPAASLLGVPSSLEVGVPSVWNVSVNGGAPPYEVTIAFGDGNGSELSGNGPFFDFTHATERAGNLTVVVTVTDEVGLTGSLRQSLRGTPGPSVVLTTQTPTADAGIAIALEAAVSGSSPWTFAWTFGDGTNATGTAPNVSHAYATSGSYHVVVTATDEHGSPADASEELSVVPSPRVEIVLPRAVAGSPAIFSTNLSGGTAPFAIAWSFGDAGSGAGPTSSHIYASAGTYAVGVWVNDSAGGSTVAHAQVIVVAAAAGTTGSSSSAEIPAWYWGALGILVVGTIGVAALLLRRRP
ncbi:MAG: PKD domain-containing protein [Thermoplasmata archaeon]|nr:PKD domain-containing protein [Thermoplasmata archaeon]